MGSVVFKIALALVLIISAFIVARVNTRRGDAYSASLPIMLAILIRLAIFVLVYYVLGATVPSDVRDFYYPQAKAALSGGIWNLDFPSSYSPLFPYVEACLLLVADNPLTFVLFSLCFDILTLWFWNRLVADFDSKAAAEVSIAYAFSAPVILTALVGQQQIWIGAGLAASAYLLVRNKTAASGFLQGLTLCTTKVLVVLFWPALFGASNRRTRWVASAILAPLITLIIFAFLGAEFLRGFRAEQLDFTSGNAIYYLDYLLEIGLKTPWVYDIITFVALCAVSSIITVIFFTLEKSDGAVKTILIIFSVSLLLATFMITSKKSYTNYLSFAYFPWLFVFYKGLSGKGFFGAWSLLSVAGSAQASLWFANGGNHLWLKDWINAAGWRAVLPSLITEIVLLVLYAWIATYTLIVFIRRCRRI